MVVMGRLVDGVAARVKQLYPDDARRAGIVVAAVEAIESANPAAGLAWIAERAGIQRPHLYRHFASKEQLDAEVVRIAALDLRDRLQPHLSGDGSPEETVRVAVGAAADWATENPQLYRFIAAPPSREVARGRERFVSDVRVALQEYGAAHGLELDVSEAVIAGVVGLIESSLIWWLDHRAEPREAVVDRLARQVTALFIDVAGA